MPPWLNGHEFEQTPGDGEEQGRLVCPWVTKSRAWLSDWTTTLPMPREMQALFLFFFFNESFSLCVLAALGLGYRVQSFSSCSEWGQLFRGTRASHCSGFSLQSTGFSSWSPRALEPLASVVVVHGLSRSSACGLFPKQGSNPCPLCWQAES